MTEPTKKARLLKVTVEWENETEVFDLTDGGEIFLVLVKQLANNQLDVRARWVGGRTLWRQVFIAFGQMDNRLSQLEAQKAVSDYVDAWVEDVLEKGE